MVVVGQWGLFVILDYGYFNARMVRLLVSNSIEADMAYLRVLMVVLHPQYKLRVWLVTNELTL